MLTNFNNCPNFKQQFRNAIIEAGITAPAEVIDDRNAEPIKIKRVLLCSGKIYYELLEKKEADKRNLVYCLLRNIIYSMRSRACGTYTGSMDG